MVFPKARLAVSAGLFLAWIGFLVYLVVRTRHPVILSRPQLAESQVVILAEVHGPKDGRPSPLVTIKNVAWSLAGKETPGVGMELTIEGLPDCGKGQGWDGPEEYIVPLTKSKIGSGHRYQVTPLPVSPGYGPAFVTVELFRVGPEKEKVAELVGKLLGGADKKGPVTKGILGRNIPREKAEDLKKKLEAAKASVRLTEGEQRIYRATPEALEQLEELKPR